MSRRTSCIVSFGSNALVTSADAIITVFAGGLQGFGNVDDLETNTVATRPYATYEPNFWLLDGGYKFAPDTNAHGGWISTSMSPSTGAFDFVTKPELLIDFTVVHSTSGLYLKFSEYTGDYADSIRVTFYDAALATIREDFYTPTSTTFFTNQPITNFKRILIQIISTNRASRYARLERIDFDTLTRFQGADIKEARVVEEINPLSLELPINTLELDLFSTAGNFSIVAPTGFYANLQYKEPLDVHEDINGSVIYIGRFYLDAWESLSENEARFEASDAIGLLEKKLFLIPNIFTAYLNSEDIIEHILSDAGIDYELDVSLNGINVAGTYPGIFLVMSCRDALQNVLFVIGAYATCSRSNLIRIRPCELIVNSTSYDYTLTQAEKGMSSPLTLRPLVTGVQVETHNYINVTDTPPRVVLSDTLALGEYTVIYDRPMNTLEGGTLTRTIIEETSLYIKINVTVAGTYTLEETNYFRDVTTLKSLNGSFPVGTPVSIHVITDAILVRTSTAAAIMQRVYDYFAQRYLQNTKLFGSFIAPGDSVLVNVQSSRQMKGIVERMETDLAGGYVSNVDIVGVVI